MKNTGSALTASPAPVSTAIRRRLPDDRKGITRRFTIAGAEPPVRMYVTAGLYEDGKPGEIFIKLDKQGSTLSGWADGLAVCISLGLQYGVPLEAIVRKLKGMRFEPAGTTGDPEQPFAASLLDFLAGWLERRFLGGVSKTP